MTILVKERIYEVPAEQQPFDRLLQTLYYSVLVYSIPVVAAVVAGAERLDFEILFEERADTTLTCAIALGVLLALPLVLAYGGRRWMVSTLRPKVLERAARSCPAATRRRPSSRIGRRRSDG